MSTNEQDKVRKYTDMAKGGWEGAEWVQGTGRYASVADCRCLTVKLFDKSEQALKAKDFIDRMGCGGQCKGNHIFMDLDQG